MTAARDCAQRVLAQDSPVPRRLVYECEARLLVRGKLSLLAPGRERDGTNPDPDDIEFGLLKLPFSRLGTSQPCVVGRRHIFAIVDQHQQRRVVTTMIPR